MLVSKALQKYLEQLEEKVLLDTNSIFHSKLFFIANYCTFKVNAMKSTDLHVEYNLNNESNSSKSTNFNCFESIDFIIKAKIKELILSWYSTVDFEAKNNFKASAEILNNAVKSNLNGYFCYQQERDKFKAVMKNCIKEIIDESPQKESLSAIYNFLNF